MNVSIFKPLARQLLPIILLMSLPAAAGCDSVHSRLRTFFHPEESPQGFDGDTGITLKIEPNTDLEIYLDGEMVASESPYSARFLAAGKHQFVLKAAGFFPLAVALNLETGRHLTIPVALRARAASANDASGDTIKPEMTSGPELPQQIKPVRLEIKNSFGATPKLDGHPTDSLTTLNRTWGQLSLNDMTLSYRFDQFGQLEIVLPAATTQWHVQGREVAPGSAHRLEASGLRISEQSPGQSPRSVTLSRP